jgi:hypothetical protein
MNTTWHTETGRLALQVVRTAATRSLQSGLDAGGHKTGPEPSAPCFLDFRRFSGWADGDGSNPTRAMAVSRANYTSAMQFAGGVLAAD